MHPAIQRFCDNLGAKPYCSSNGMATAIRQRDQALRHTYVSLNRRRVAYLAFDIDRRGAAYAHEGAGLPAPTLTMINPANAHAHMLYELTAPIPHTDAAHIKPIRFFADVESRMLSRLGADPAFAGLMIKNPASSAWRTIANDARYDLGTLLEYLPDKQSHKLVVPTGYKRNCILFDRLREIAYSRVNISRESGYEHWHSWLLHEAEQLNNFDAPLAHAEVRSIVKSVSRWTWKNYTGSIQAGRVLAAAQTVAAQYNVTTSDAISYLSHVVAKLAEVPERTLRHLRKTKQV